MSGLIKNRDSFLGHIAGRLGRERPRTSIERPKWNYQPQDKTLVNLSQDELVDILREQCKNILTDFEMTTTAGLAERLREVVNKYGGGSIVIPRDDRFSNYGLSTLLDQEWPKEGIEVHIWDHTKGAANIDMANHANVGITVSDITLAESGTAVLFSSKNLGRTISFLPETSIIIIPKSSIVPRMTQAARIINEKVKNGEQISSCINFITGPSNSADIEMILVVGVHGPVKVTYVVVEDL
jgi:L-lactate dehydrogenase complex protein LldG